MGKYLAACSLSEARGYSGKLYRVTEKVNKSGKETKTREQVFLNVVVDGSSEEGISEILKSGIGAGSVITVNKDVPLSGIFSIPEDLQNKIFIKCKYEDLDEVREKSPEGVRILCTVPEKYNMYDLANLSSVDKRIRFTGNVLMRVPGLSIGRFDAGELTEKSGHGPTSICQDYFDDFEEIDFSEIKNEVTETSAKKPARVRKPKTSIDVYDLDKGEGTEKKAPAKKKLTRAELRKRMLAGRR